MATIDGTVLLDGAPPGGAVAGDINILDFDLNDPILIGPWPFPGSPFLDPNATTVADANTGVYSITVADVNSHKLVVSADDTVKSTWYGDVTSSGLSAPLVGNQVGIDIDCDSDDGTYPSGVTLNCPVGTVIVQAFILDPDMWVILGFSAGVPDGDYNAGTPSFVYAAGPYRMIFVAYDAVFTPLAAGFYDNLAYTDYASASAFPGASTGIDHDFAPVVPVVPDLLFWPIPMGSGPHPSVKHARRGRR